VRSTREAELTGLRELIDAGLYDRAWRSLIAQAQVTTDASALFSLARQRRQLLKVSEPLPMPSQVRIALIGGATTSLFEEPLQLLLETHGVQSTLQASPFNTVARQMLDDTSETVAFKPDIAVVVTTPANIETWPSFNAPAADVQPAVDDECEHWVGLCRSLHEHARCEIIVDNFHALPLRPLGAAGPRTAGDRNRFLAAVNVALADRLPPYAHVHDVASLAAMHGVYRWFDPRYWYHGKHPVSLECLVPYVRSLAQLIAALRGRSAKCLVLDLDNTLWGGIVGDDGPEGLLIGPGDPVGEAFQSFQRYVVDLKTRGVVLAVCSKNDEHVALAPFSARPEMLLRRDDFAVFIANWEPKSQGLRQIAERLQLGLDALVMVDDNPAERAEIRQALPEVRVVEVGTDPSDYPLALERTGWFEAVTLSPEDMRRAEMYSENAARDRLRGASGDYTAYLESLEQRARIAPFEPSTLDRVAQLTGKTNQFNLTTLRLSRSELEAMMESSSYLTATVRLEDRFGDNGLISVFAARGEGDELWIDLWLMSCRVLSRGVEQLLCNHVVERATDAGYRLLHGIYRPTSRNQMVSQLYERLGFAPAEPVGEGTHWVLDLPSFTPFSTTIELIEVARLATYGGRDD
jgi:FkbH-like protein